MKTKSYFEIIGLETLSANDSVKINGGKSLRQWLDELMSGNATFWY